MGVHPYLWVWLCMWVFILMETLRVKIHFFVGKGRVGIVVNWTPTTCQAQCWEYSVRSFTWKHLVRENPSTSTRSCIILLYSDDQFEKVVKYGKEKWKCGKGIHIIEFVKNALGIKLGVSTKGFFLPWREWGTISLNTLHPAPCGWVPTSCLCDYSHAPTSNTETKGVHTEVLAPRAWWKRGLIWLHSRTYQKNK